MTEPLPFFHTRSSDGADLVGLTVPEWNEHISRRVSEIRRDRNRFTSKRGWRTVDTAVRFLVEDRCPWGWVDVNPLFDSVPGTFWTYRGIGLVAPSLPREYLAVIAGAMSPGYPEQWTYRREMERLAGPAFAGQAFYVCPTWADMPVHEFIKTTMTSCMTVVRALEKYDKDMATEAAAIGVRPEPLPDSIRAVPGQIHAAVWDTVTDVDRSTEQMAQIAAGIDDLLTRVAAAVDAGWERLAVYASPGLPAQEEPPRPTPADQLRALAQRIDIDHDTHRLITGDVHGLNHPPAHEQ
jgi:hypothetical protein